MLGNMMNKFGSQLERGIKISNIMAGRKTDQKTKFNRHGVNNTSLMVQNLLKSKPLLYRRYIDPKHISPPPPPVAKASVVLDS